MSPMDHKEAFRFCHRALHMGARKDPVERWRIWDLKMWVGILVPLFISCVTWAVPQQPPSVQQVIKNIGGLCE